jgi:hypothetical protein
MGRFIKRYTDEQKDALLHAVLIDNVSVAEAVRRATRGELGVASFTFNLQYAYQVIKTGREDFEARNPEALGLATARELQRAHHANLRALRGLKEDADPGERARLAKHVAETWRAMGSGGAKPKRGERPSTNTPKTESERDHVLERLLNHGHKPNPDVPQPTSHVNTGVAATNTTSQPEDEGENGRGPVRSRAQ